MEATTTTNANAIAAIATNNTAASSGPTGAAIDRAPAPPTYYQLWSRAVDLWPHESMSTLAQRINKYEAIYLTCMQADCLNVTTALSCAINTVRNMTSAETPELERPVIIHIRSLGVYVVLMPGCCIYLLETISAFPGGRDVARIIPADVPGELVTAAFMTLGADYNERAGIVDAVRDGLGHVLTCVVSGNGWSSRAVFTACGVTIAAASMLDEFVKVYRCVATRKPGLARFLMPLMPQYEGTSAYYTMSLPGKVSSMVDLQGRLDCVV